MFPLSTTYSDLEKTFLRLGFTKEVRPTGHVHFIHSEGALFFARAYRPDEIVREIVLIEARSTVDGWGIADRETFERLLVESVGQSDDAKTGSTHRADAVTVAA